MGKYANIYKILDLWENREEYFENPIYDYNNISKEKIKIIYWTKKWNYIRHVPDNYTYPWTIWYALMRSFNCQSRCLYCYLQSYFKSSDIVSFKNIEDYILFLDKFIKRFKHKYWNDKWLVFFDWDFQDSLWYYWLNDNIIQLNEIIKLIDSYDNVSLEIRTKNIIDKNEFELYDNLIISDKVVYGITFSPQDIIEKYEIWTSDLYIRMNFAKYITNKWWKIWVRIDPIILYENEILLEKYKKLIDDIKLNIKSDVYNWSVWLLRLKDSLYKKLKKSNNDIINNLELDWDFWKYPKKIRNFVYNDMKVVIDSNNFFICMDDF